MAKITTGPLVSEIRNALGAQVFSRNQYGAYTKARTAPDQTPTPPRVAARDRFAAATVAWESTLTDLQRRAWMTYADALRPRPGPVNGRPRAGRPLFISSYCNLDNIGVPTLTDPPDQPVAGAVLDLTGTINADAAVFTLTGTVPPDTPAQGLVIFATPPLSAARYYGSNLSKQIAAYPPGWSWPLDLQDAYREVFDTPAAPAVVIVYVLPIAEASGLAGVRQQARILATGEGSPMLIKTTVLTDAQIKALPTTDVTVVPAVAGKIIVPFILVLQADATAGAYANISPGNTEYFRLKVNTDKSSRIRNNRLLSGAAKECAILSIRQEIDAVPPTLVALYTSVDDPATITNVPAVLAVQNTAGDFTGGHVDNTLTVTTYYELLDPV